MFKKLRNRVLLLNMVITSTVVLAAFSIIYFMTYSNIHSEIERKLDTKSEVQIMTAEEAVAKESDQGGLNVFASNGSSGDPLLFNIEVDTAGKILTVNSAMNMEQKIYKQAAKVAWSNPNSTAVITLGDKQWRYAVVPVSIHTIGQSGEKTSSSEENRFSINFLDVTAYNKSLFDLMTTLSLVGVITIGAIFIISLYFANRTVKPLAEAWKKQKQFVADASHELKTPLSIINANYDALLANQEETIRSQMKWLDYMRIGTDRMAKLINDLLTLAKFEDTKLVTQTISFNLSDAVKVVLSSMEAAIMEKGIELSVSIEADITVKSDPEGVKQVVTILLDNAIKYTDTSGQIDIVLAQSKRQAVFSIHNSCKGIPEQELPKIFDRFYRADLSRTHESGSYGLGLSIAKALIDRMGGDIQVQSVEGELTTFTFRLKAMMS